MFLSGKFISGFLCAFCCRFANAVSERLFLLPDRSEEWTKNFLLYKMYEIFIILLVSLGILCYNFYRNRNAYKKEKRILIFIKRMAKIAVQMIFAIFHRRKDIQERISFSFYKENMSIFFDGKMPPNKACAHIENPDPLMHTVQSVYQTGRVRLIKIL